MYSQEIFCLQWILEDNSTPMGPKVITFILVAVMVNLLQRMFQVANFLK
jgi:hypothetical protein